MGKKNYASGNKRKALRQQQRQQKKNALKEKPMVNICTPTFNRRPFFEAAIQCYLNQDYPRDKLEWIIIDDGTDKIGDLVKDVPGVKYFEYPEKMTLGKKRNLMHDKSCGDIIVYMDDDDYYPEDRVSHAVHMLVTHPKALAAGSSEIYIWFKHIQKMYQFGPYGPNHSTAGTFAIKRELLEQTSYNEEASIAEEKAFLKDYTIPFVQLNPKKTILVFSHEQNTFDKRKLLTNPNPKFVKESDKTVDDFIKEPELKEFFMEKISGLLEEYEPGLAKYKPDVLKQTAEIEERRKKKMDEMMQQQQQARGGEGQIIIQQNGKNVPLSNHQVVAVLKQQQEKLQKNDTMISDLNKRMQMKIDRIKELEQKVRELSSQLESSS